MGAVHLGRRFPLCIALVLAALSPKISAQNTYYVDDDATAPGHGTWTEPYTRIQQAISAPDTQSGDTIRVLPGIYRERLDFLHGLTVVSEAGPDQTVIDAAFRGSAVSIRHQSSSPSRLEGFTLRNGTGRYNPLRGEALGGGVYCLNSLVTIVDCRIVANSTRVGGPDSLLAGRGGGIYVGTNTDLALLGCTIADNDAVDGGGIFVDRGRLQMSGGAVLANRALGDAYPGRGGGLLVAARSRIALSGVFVESNLALGSDQSIEAVGGGIRLDANSLATIDNCTIAWNDSGGFSLGYGDLSGYGGGVSSMASATDFTMSSTLVHDNWGNNGGGGVHGKGSLVQCTIEGNHGQFGGGVSAIDMTLQDCVLRDNRGGVSGSYDWGGGIYVGPGRFARLERCELDSNHAFGQGGGGWGGTYVDCDIHDNTAWADSSAGFVAGGGVFGGDLVGCVLWNNSSHEDDYQSAEGGGLHGGSARHSIFFNNDADSGGGAMSSQLDRCTLVANLSILPAGGGVGFGTIHDSIVRFNVPDDVFGSSSVTWSNVPAGIPGTGNISDDPMLWNVGAHDYRLMPGSPCIDAGDPTSPPDPDGSRADMGALPYGG